MPRRNNRGESYQPLDLTPADVRQYVRHEPEVHFDPAAARRQRAERRREAAERQHNARVNHGIDWTVCVVPGCGDELSIRGSALHPHERERDHTIVLPLCFQHLAVAYQQAVRRSNDALMVKTSTLVAERKEARTAEQHKAMRKQWLEQIDGHIYFVRLNGLVKVGWSRDVDDRLRAYGPDVEVLTVYPGSRDDETNLHRQLRPALARGREWYEDNDIITAFVVKAVAEHGPPKVHTAWTRPKQLIKPRRRAG